MRPSGKLSLHHISGRREKNQRAVDKLITLFEESLLPAHFFFTCTRSTGRPVYEPSSELSQKRKSSRDLENERMRILHESKFLLKSEFRSRSTNFKPILIEDVSWNLLESLILSEWKLIILGQGVTNPGEINYYKNYQNKIGLFVKLVSGKCETWKNFRKVSCQRSRNFKKKID